MNYWDFIRTKSLCIAKETVNKTKRQGTEWENIFANDISDKGFIPKIYEEFINLNTQKNTKEPVKKWAEDMNRRFCKEDIQQTHEKVLKITQHQGNTNQNHNEIKLHTSKNG